MTSSYTAPPHFAVQNMSALSDTDVAFWVEACRLQLRDHVCPAWGLTPPGVGFYVDAKVFPEGTALAALFVDDLHDPGVLGEHGVLGTPFVLIDAHLGKPGETLSHELCEATCNQWLDRYSEDVLGQDGKVYRYPKEACDPVEENTYPMKVTIGTETRQVLVSDFVFPAWFDPASAASDFDQLRVLSSPLEIADGGYAAPEVNGQVTFIGREPALHWHKFHEQSRLVRLMRRAPRRKG